MWLPKAKVKTPPRGKADLDDIWNACGNHCAWCGMTRARLEEVGIGLQADHVVPFWKNGDEWPVQPLCARCHQEKNARQAATRALEENVAEFKTIIERIEAKNPHLRRS
jgi:5-methylcytosine-specific restriction endonuclease McrA